MKKWTKIAVASVLIGGLTVPALYAQGDGEKPDRPKAKQERGGMLKEMDTDNDGSVTKQEFYAWHKERIEKRFDQMDKNNDGVINQDDRKKKGKGPGDGDGDAQKKKRERRDKDANEGGAEF